jgi:hypothetical protein
MARVGLRQHRGPIPCPPRIFPLRNSTPGEALYAAESAGEAIVSTTTKVRARPRPEAGPDWPSPSGKP